MASWSGNSCISTKFQRCESEEDLQILMLERKRKRMQLNRESARRSRLRKQKQVDDLMAQVGQLQKVKSEIMASINITTEQYVNVEAENSTLRAQIVELSQRLQSLIHIINLINSTLTTTEPHSFFYPENNMPYLNQPIGAASWWN